MAPRIIGIGQSMAGDDGVGVAVADRVSRSADAAEIEVVKLAEPSRLVPLLTDGADPVVLIDGVLDAGSPGRIVVLKAEHQTATRLLSTHGVGVRDAIALAHAIDPENIAARIVIVGITIAPANRWGENLSPAVAAAVPPAAAKAITLARE